MYIVNGICYAGEPVEGIEVVAVKVLDDMMMLLTFSTGETRIFDATVLEGSAFLPLKQKEIFENVILEHGVVTWVDGEIDCAPEYMYSKSFPYEKVS